MSKKLLLVAGIILASMFTGIAKAQDDEPVPAESFVKEALADSICARYYDWETVSMSGKLSSPMLPVSASVKIYMERDSLVVISISAILMGEVARIEIDNERMLAVNKMKNTYSIVAMSDLEQVCPGGLKVLQNMILGRISIIGSGTISAENSSEYDMYPMDEGEWLIWPTVNNDPNAPYQYVYTVDTDTWLTDTFMVASESEGISADCTYQWNKKEVEIDLQLETGRGGIGATLKLNYPDSKTKVIEPIELSSKYREVSISKLLTR